MICIRTLMIDRNVVHGRSRYRQSEPSAAHWELYTVRICVLHFELMKNPTMLARHVRDLAFPFVELTKCHGIAIECRKASSIFENRIRQQVCVALTSRRESLTFGPAQFFK